MGIVLISTGKILLFAVPIAGAGLVMAVLAARKPAVESQVRPAVSVTDIVAANQPLVDSAVRRLQTGQVVVRMGVGADSRMLREMNQADKRYSHCGIVVVEHGYPFVYHSIGGEDNPDQRLRRDSAVQFFSPIHNTEIAALRYDMDNATVARFTDVVHTYYRSRPWFDMQFDLATDNKLYCSEFVYKAVGKAVGSTGYLPTSEVAGHTYVGIDNLYLNKHAAFIFQMKFK